MLTKGMDMKNMRKLLKKLVEGIKEVNTSQDEMKIRVTDKIKDVKSSQNEMKTCEV